MGKERERSGENWKMEKKDVNDNYKQYPSSRLTGRWKENWPRLLQLDQLTENMDASRLSGIWFLNP